jgi:hypothetical protein
VQHSIRKIEEPAIVPGHQQIHRSAVPNPASGHQFVVRRFQIIPLFTLEERSTPPKSLRPHDRTVTGGARADGISSYTRFAGGEKKPSIGVPIVLTRAFLKLFNQFQEDSFIFHR